MTSKSRVSPLLFDRKYKRNDNHKESSYSKKTVHELLRGLRNEQNQRVKKVSPYRRPPVPVVLDPTPAQITPIGTIPLYYKHSSKHS